MSRIALISAAALLSALAGTSLAQGPISTAFTYQGELRSSGAPISGLYDLRFRLYDSQTGGTQLGQQLCVDNLALAEGRFSIPLDFGAQFSGSPRFLEVDVRPDTGLNCASASGFITLAPRQSVSPAPYSLFSAAPWQTNGATLSYTAGPVGIGTTSPGMRLTVAGDMEMGTSSGDYHRFRIGGGNSDGFLYGSWPALGDGIHMGYNWYADAAGAGHTINSGGAASRVSAGYGYVGLATGWGTPTDKLTVDPYGHINTFGSPGQSSTAYMYNGAGQAYIYLGTSASGIGQPLMGCPNPAAGLAILRSGLNCIGVVGSMFADVKNFRTENPRQPGTDIVYACIEGPEAAAYMRGTGHLSNGHATVRLPVHFQDIAVADGMTVQLTPCSGLSRGLAVTAQDTEHFEVDELSSGAGTYDFHWRVEAVRKGFEHYEVIRPTAERMVPMKTQP